jgi:hypothetical protein
MDKKKLHGYEEPDTIMICPEEGYAYDTNGNPYHKLRGGCGWTGLRKECEEKIGMTSYHWIEYLCPNCDGEQPYYHMVVEDRDELMIKLEDPSLIPPMNPIFRQASSLDLLFGQSSPLDFFGNAPLSSYPGGFKSGRQYFIDTFKDGDERYYEKENK